MSRILFLIAGSAFLLDQVSKYVVLYVLRLPDILVIDVLPPFLRFVMAWNRGINFGLGASDGGIMRWTLVIVSIAISVAIVIWARRRADKWFTVGAGLVVGGALGNAVDRIIHGAVADFLNMSCCGIVNPYSFNIADVAIFAGAGLLIWRSGDEKAKVS